MTSGCEIQKKKAAQLKMMNFLCLKHAAVLFGQD